VECQFSVEKVKGQGHRTTKTSTVIWRRLLTRGGSSAGGSGADCKLGLTTVRPNLLPMPETLRSGTGRTAAYHVGTRRRYLFCCIKTPYSEVYS